MEQKNKILDKRRICPIKPEHFISVVPDLTKLQRKVEDEQKLKLRRGQGDLI